MSFLNSLLCTRAAHENNLFVIAAGNRRPTIFYFESRLLGTPSPKQRGRFKYHYVRPSYGEGIHNWETCCGGCLQGVHEAADLGGPGKGPINRNHFVGKSLLLLNGIKRNSLCCPYAGRWNKKKIICNFLPHHNYYFEYNFLREFRFLFLF